jgi:hypothetical protein
MDAVPAAGGPLPGAVVLPAGWTVADTTVAIRRPSAELGTARPVVIAFGVDLTGAASGSRWLLLALLHAGPLTPNLGGAADLRELVRRSPHVAARSFEVL